MKDLKYLFTHIGWSERAIEWHKQLVEEYKKAGYQVDAHCLIPNPPAPRYTYQRLDKLWQKRDKNVVAIYEQLKEVISDYDVLVNFNGANIHPEWLASISTFNVYICFDDPESSSNLSEPVAKYFDFSFTGNASCVQLYLSWGIKNCDFLPLACHPSEYDNQMSVERILRQKRESDLIFLGERVSPWRQKRLDKVRAAFPNAIMRGRGWGEGFLADDEKIKYYTNTKIGLNIHNSVGPVNLRTYSLPANGLLQIIDNKHRAGSLFKLNEEVVGFDEIDEGIELIKYYLNHDKERKEIAAKGFERVMQEFTPQKQWLKVIDSIKPYYKDKVAGLLTTPSFERGTNNDLTTIKSFVKHTFRKSGLQITKLKDDSEADLRAVQEKSYKTGFLSYHENPEAGAINFEDKVRREKAGGFFEWPNIVALNWAVTTLLGDSKKIVDVGCGTGAFAYEAASDPTKFILAADLNEAAIKWARKHRQKDNIVFEHRMINKKDGPFDIAVSIEVIEHVKDYVSFIRLLQSLAPKAIITTPNKDRSGGKPIGPPSYSQHTREWTAGEFYWILKSFYKSVQLYSMPNEYLPELTAITVDDKDTPLVALCECPVN